MAIKGYTAFSKLGATPSDHLVSYLGYSLWGRSYSSAELGLVGVSYSSSQLGKDLLDQCTGQIFQQNQNKYIVMQQDGDLAKFIKTFFSIFCTDIKYWSNDFNCMVIHHGLFHKINKSDSLNIFIYILCVVVDNFFF